MIWMLPWHLDLRICRQITPKRDKPYLNILKENKRHLGAHEQLGWVYYYEANYPKSKEEFEIVQKSEPRNASALIGLGWISMAEKKWEDAYDYFDDLMDDYPEHPTAKEAMKTITQHYKP